MFHRIRTDEQGKKKEPVEQQTPEANTESSELLEAILEDAPEEVQESIREEAQQDDTDTQEEATPTETPNETAEEEAETMTAEPQTQNFEIEDETAVENENTQTRSPSNAMPGTPYQAQPAPVSRAPGSYPGASSYAAAPTSNYGSQPSQETEKAIGDRKLTIGPGINMSGEIESCDHLIVEGTVEAALRGASFLEIEETGTYYGSVEISEAIIAGRFEGDLAVDGRITIRSTGVVTGTISYKELEVESGAVIEGRINPMKATQQDTAQSDGQRAKERASAIAKAKEIKAKQAEHTPANNDGALFQNTAAAE